MAGKSLTQTAKAVLMKESNDPTPDREAKSMNPNKATLRPNSKYKEERFANPGAPGEGEFDQYEDLGPALVKQGDVPPSAKASGSMKKDSSKSSQASVSGEPPKSLSEEEEIEISEELKEFIENCIAEGMNEDEIEAAISENFEIIEEEVAEDAPEIVEEETLETAPIDMSEHVNALLEGEDLSEEFKSKATTIFESAVKEIVSKEVEVLEEAYEKSLQEQVETIYDTLAEEVENYLDYVIQEWTKQNEVAIESGLTTELTQDFISGLRDLFAEHYIDIPEDKVDVIDQLGSQVQELTAKLNEQIEKNVELTKDLSESTKFKIMVDESSSLTATEAARLHSLAEGIEFTTEDEFKAKIHTLKESYFPTRVENKNVLDAVESNDKGMISESLTGPMANYVKVLGKHRQQ